jgi:2'-5' RNA ligase
MLPLETHVDPADPVFLANRDRMDQLVADLRARLARAREGGGAKAIERASNAETAVAIKFDRICTFAGPPLVLWAAPASADKLLRMHGSIHTAIEPSLCRPYYRPNAWTPHCTLATRVRDELRADALAFAEGFRGGVETVFDAIDCVAFSPLRLAAQQRLRAPD